MASHDVDMYIVHDVIESVIESAVCQELFSERENENEKLLRLTLKLKNVTKHYNTTQLTPHKIVQK